MLGPDCRSAKGTEYFVKLLVLTTLYAVGGRLGLSLAHIQDNATLIWPPTGIALAALILCGRRLWPGVFLGALVVNWQTDVAWLPALAIATGNTLEAVFGAFLLERVARFRPALERVRDVVSFLACGAVACTMVSATIGVGTLYLSGGVEASAFEDVWLTWWLGDAGGAILVAPILLLLRVGRPAWSALLPLKEFWLVFLGLLGGCLLAFGGFTSGTLSQLSAFLPFPFLVWAGTRLGPRGAMLASGLTATAAIVGTARGLGPFTMEGTQTSLLLLWSYAITMGTAALMLAAAIAQREHAEEQRRAEEDSRLRLERKVNQAQRLESLGLLAGGVAHDFNNILAAIRGNAELLGDHVGRNDEARDMLSQIEMASDRAADLCRRLLSYAGRRPASMETVLFSELVEETSILLLASIPRTVTVETSVRTGNLAVEGDPTQLRQVLMNLALNGVEALGSEPGTVWIEAGTAELGDHDLIQLHSADSARKGLFGFVEVRDTGCGMDGETAERMFDPFFTTKFEGRGLGLAAVLGIVQTHGGAIDMRSLPGKGTSVRVYLPAVGGKAAEIAVPAPLPARSDRGRVLVADDEPAVRRVVTRMLETVGYEVQAVADGVEAVDTFRQQPGAFRLVLLDMTMPRKNGVEARDDILAIDKGMRVILMTGYEPSDVVSAVDPETVLRKPFSTRQLLEWVDRART